MSRYRPPAIPGSKYITPEGAKRLRDELHELWAVERPRVTAAVAAAAAQGDRSENAEYTYGKKRLHEILRRVRHLRKRLEGMTVVDTLADAERRDARRVYFGAWVLVEDEDGGRRWRRIVGPDEFDMCEDYVSMDSPLARGLMRRAIDDEVTIESPSGPRRLTIVEIRYGPRP